MIIQKACGFSGDNTKGLGFVRLYYIRFGVSQVKIKKAWGCQVIIQKAWGLSGDNTEVIGASHVIIQKSLGLSGDNTEGFGVVR